MALLLSTLALSACSPPLGCSGAAIRPVGVDLDASAWLDAHPGSQLRASLDDGEDALMPPTSQLDAGVPVGKRHHFELVVVSTLSSASRLAIRQEIDIPVTTLPGRGGGRQQHIGVSITADGTVEIPSTEYD